MANLFPFATLNHAPNRLETPESHPFRSLVLFDRPTLTNMYRDHGLPFGWEEMEYEAFLRQRRSLMAQTIRQGYERLAGHETATPSMPSVAEMVSAGESAAVEFKSTLRTNRHTGEKDAKMELAVLRTIAGFLNQQGGTLIIGIADDGSPVGVEADGFPSEDKMALHLVNLLKDRLGGQHALHVHPRFDDYDGVRTLIVSCGAAKSPVFVKDGPAAERFFVRYGPSTQELAGGQAQEYIKQRFPAAA
ncbi:MAG: RNA-binding domain-containing protein [Inquilinus sp.]|uniref:AlbA family DNA-binding domain-containing protein n=1 Tax=Inquilinus sp. TaxID=1932117 RepID=UPI003F39E503